MCVCVCVFCLPVSLLPINMDLGDFTLYRTSPPGLPLKLKPFLKRIKEKTKKTKPFRTLVVARLSSSKVWSSLRSLLPVDMDLEEFSFLIFPLPPLMI